MDEQELWNSLYLNWMMKKTTPPFPNPFPPLHWIYSCRTYRTEPKKSLIIIDSLICFTALKLTDQQGYLFFCFFGGGGKNMAKYHVGEKILFKGDEKKGGNAYCFPNWLQTTKIAKNHGLNEEKGWQIFACGAHPLIIHFIQNIIQERGEAKNMNFEFYIHPCLLGGRFASASFIS